MSVIAADNGRVLMYSNNVSTDYLVKENFRLHHDLEQYQKANVDSSILTAASKVRSDILNMAPPYSFPYVSELRESGAEQLPQSLNVLLSSIVVGSPTAIKPAALRRVHSIASDVIYATTAARIKLAKHILLPSGIKSLTGNVEIIHMLNRLGHGISYSHLMEIDTAVAMARQDSDNTLIPSCVRPHVFTTLAWDNIDKLEETLSGAGTTQAIIWP